MTARSLAHDPQRLRRRLADARLMLLFTPDACAPRDPMRVLEAALISVDVVQIRPKGPTSFGPCAARDTFDWCVRVLDHLSARPDLDVLVIVDDRVDVAAALRERGCAGVHIGQDDCPAAMARRILGPDPLIGLSTHDMTQVGEAGESPVDYLGFGPIHATSTKGYARGLGVEPAWIAAAGAHVPVFAIGGIDATNIADLARIGRAAVSSAILRADDPGIAAVQLRNLLLT